MFDLGDLVPLSIEVKDADGVLTNASSVTLTITLPDGTVVTPNVDNPPSTTGIYLGDYSPTIAGRHTARWVVTGPNGAYIDTFDVRPAQTSNILSLDEAKRHLNMRSNVDDDELRAMIEAVTAVVERHREECIARRTIIEEQPLGTYGRIALTKRPVIEILSITDHNGMAVPFNNYLVDNQLGILVKRTPDSRRASTLRISYTAGYQVIPANYILAAKIILAHLWQTQRIQNIGPTPTLNGSSRREEAIITPSGMGYAIPHRAVELLGHYPSWVV